MDSGWYTVAASAVGASHLRNGSPCQDSFAVRHAEDGTLVFAVADGAGSAAHALAASARAVSSAVGWLVERLEAEPPANEVLCEQVLRECLDAVRSRLLSLGQELVAADVSPPERAIPVPARDLATTLLTGFLSGNHLATLHVGDGAAVVSGAEGLRTWSSPDHGEHVNETTFLLEADAAARCAIRVGPSQGLRGLAVLSDGLESLGILHADKTAHPGFFDPLFAFARSPEASDLDIAVFLGSPAVCGRSDDDKTLLLAVPRADRSIG